MSVMHCISSFERRYPCKKLQIKLLVFFYFLLFYISFYISQYCDSLEFHSTFIWKDIFITNFPFFNRFIKTPHLLGQNTEWSKSAKCDESFLLCSLNTIEAIQLSYRIFSITYLAISFILYLIANDCHCLGAGYPIL